MQISYNVWILAIISHAFLFVNGSASYGSSQTSKSESSSANARASSYNYKGSYAQGYSLTSSGGLDDNDNRLDNEKLNDAKEKQEINGISNDNSTLKEESSKIEDGNNVSPTNNENKNEDTVDKNTTTKIFKTDIKSKNRKDSELSPSTIRSISVLHRIQGYYDNLNTKKGRCSILIVLFFLLLVFFILLCVYCIIL